MKTIWMLLAVLLAGCTASGGYVPVAPMEMKKKMVNEYDAPTTIYVEPVTGRGTIGKKFISKGKEIAVVLNLDEMSLFVANSLSAELVKKGAVLNRDADKVIRVEVVDANMSYSATYLVEGTVEFHLSDGYVGTCSFNGSGVKAYRALGGALQWGVANIINHNNVRSFLVQKDAQELQKVSTSELPDYGTEAKYKLAILPFKAGPFDDSDTYQGKAIDALAASTEAIADIALTHSCYGFGDDNIGNPNLIKIDKGEEVDIWDKKWGKYVLNEDRLIKWASRLNVDLVFTCKVTCKKTGMYANCGEIIIETYLLSGVDNRLFHKKASMRIQMPGGQVALQRDYYTSDDFYIELKTTSTALFQDFLASNESD